MSNVTVQQKDATTGKVTVQKSTGGAAHTAINGAVTAVNGTMKVYSVAANAAINSGLNATEFITDATGYKAFTIDIVDDIAIALDEAVMVCWSTEVNKQVETTATLDLLRGSLGTPDGTGYANCFIMTVHTNPIPTIVYDGTTLIKTISIASQGTTSYDGVIRTIE
jgi:hypothetical protein